MSGIIDLISTNTTSPTGVLTETMINETIDKMRMEVQAPIMWHRGLDTGFDRDYQCEWKPKKEKKMKLTEHEVEKIVNKKLEAFAQKLGLNYSIYTEHLYGTIDEDFVPNPDELTQEVKDTENHLNTLMGRYSLGKTKKATVLGKLNALAEHLGVKFEVQPERVTTEKVKAVKTSSPARAKVTTKKKGKK